MPNDEWRAYVGQYYSVDEMEEFGGTKELDYPAKCVQSFRAGVHLEKMITGGDVPFFDTDETAQRSVVVVPNCTPGRAYVLWSLDSPE